MQIAIDTIQENRNDRTVFWILTDDAPADYEWHSDIPKGGEAQDHLERAILRYLLLIRKREYPTLTLDRDYVIDPSQSQLEAIEEWIADGCMLRDDEGLYTEKLDPIPWTSTHPEPVPRVVLTLEQRIAMQGANTVAQLAGVLISIFDS